MTTPIRERPSRLTSFGPVTPANSRIVGAMSALDTRELLFCIGPPGAATMSGTWIERS